MTKVKKEILLLFSFILYFVFASPVSARSGCCSWHGGVCGCGCCDGTGLSAKCAPYYPSCDGGYVAPKPVCYTPAVLKTGNVNVTRNGCLHDITISWAMSSDANQFSISLSKSAGADPGPTADTHIETKVFKNVESGRWFINLKSGNSCGWNRTSYWTVDVPKVAPTIDYFTQKRIDDDSVELSYSAKCATNATISSVGVVNLKEKRVTVIPKKDSTYKLVVNGKGGSSQQDLFVLKPTPTPSPTPTPLPTPTPARKGFWRWLFG